MEIQTVIGVVAMFLLRIGLPVLLLVAVGTLIDRWQHKREADFTNRHG